MSGYIRENESRRSTSLYTLMETISPPSLLTVLLFSSCEQHSRGREPDKDITGQWTEGQETEDETGSKVRVHTQQKMKGSMHVVCRKCCSMEFLRKGGSGTA